MAAMLGRLVAQLKMPRLDAYFEQTVLDVRVLRYRFALQEFRGMHIS